MGRAINEREGEQLFRSNDTQAELASTLGALRALVRESLEWRAWVRRHPWPALGVAALIGLRLGRSHWF
jgi:ElaB/YqjD/DUF883 family membrane-anchored ribosome-binding protein